jgi:uncharacterized DUF497 family protein
MDVNGLVQPSPRRSNEMRFITIGHSCRHQTLLVVWTEATPTMLRIISARKTTKKEKDDYEKGI